ncbi:hypothetical protein Scep_001512 [Stephania cephalantha]|uniref:Uncharacterized protein n=1 Tax=Stephania cephalantha TaxID=152367 RepID=A0AAP0L8J2_9MAGN
MSDNSEGQSKEEGLVNATTISSEDSESSFDGVVSSAEESSCSIRLKECNTFQRSNPTSLNSNHLVIGRPVSLDNPCDYTKVLANVGDAQSLQSYVPQLLDLLKYVKVGGTLCKAS